MRNPAGARGHVRPPGPEPDRPCRHDDSPLCRGRRRELERPPEEENEGRRVGGTRRLLLSPLPLHLKFRLASSLDSFLSFIIPPLGLCKVQVIFEKKKTKRNVCTVHNAKSLFPVKEMKRNREQFVFCFLCIYIYRCNVKRLTKASAGRA